MIRNIYIVTSICLDEEKLVRSRAWGWFSTKKEAIQATEANYGDMCEMGYYTHLVVERHAPGICSLPKAIIGWWKFVRVGKRNVKVVSCPTPKTLERVGAFGLG